MPNGDVSGNVQRYWNLVLVYGILMLVLGIIGLGMAVFLTLASVTFYGVLLVVGGVAQLAQTLRAAGWKAKVWQIVIGLLYIFGGIIVIRNPILVSGLFTALLATTITAVGLFRIIMAVQMRGSKGWLWVLLGGLLAFALGVWMFARLDTLSFVIIGLFISIELIANGWSAIMLLIASKSANRA